MQVEGGARMLVVPVQPGGDLDAPARAGATPSPASADDGGAPAGGLGRPPQRAWPATLSVGVGVALGVALGVGALVLKAQDGSHPLPETIAGVVGGYLFLAAGVVAHARDPSNRVGLLMVFAGAAYFAEDLQLATTSWLFGLGLLLGQASTGPLTHLLLAFPDGRLTSRAQRVLAGATYAIIFGLDPLFSPLNDTSQLPAGRDNPLYVAGPRSLIIVWSQVNASAGAVIGTGVLVVLTHRWWTASGPRRRVLAPVFVTGLVGAGATVARGLGPQDSPLRPALLWLYLVAFALLPLGFLAGIPRLRFGRTRFGTLLAQLATPLPHAELRALLASALGDPSLRIAYWRPETGTFVDEDGGPVAVGATGPAPARAGQQRWTLPEVRLVERDGHRVAALLHDPALRADPRRLAAVVAAAGLALDNQRLAAEVRAQLAEVRASRGRIVEAADAERRRLERDLHDGAQQRLITARLAVRLAQDQPPGPELADLLAGAASGLDLAIRELRELARGIHPEILTDAGLVAAVTSLVDRSPHDVRVVAADVPRLPAAVEATAYFVVAEAVTNVLRHADAARVTVEIGHDGAVLGVAVTDDGRGGADLAAGTGLLGLRDRVSALDGTLTVHSPPGRGTTVRADLPATVSATVNATMNATVSAGEDAGRAGTTAVPAGSHLAPS